MSKLDKILFCDQFMESFPGTSVTVLPRDLSDHSPIMMKTDCEDFGPRPFRFFNSWMYRKGFHEVVSRAWAEFRGFGCADSFLAAKLRFLKAEIKKWRDSNFDKENGELIECRSKIAQIDTNAELRPLLAHEIGNRSKYLSKIIEIEKVRAMDMKQKAKVKWLVDGDENTSFFHRFVNNQNRRNHIHGLLINGQWDSNPAVIKKRGFSFLFFEIRREMEESAKDS